MTFPPPPPAPPGHCYVPPQVPAPRRSSSLVPLLIVGAIGMVMLMAGAAVAILIVLMDRGAMETAGAPVPPDSPPPAEAFVEQPAAPAAPPDASTPAAEPGPSAADAPPPAVDDERVRARRRERAIRSAREAEAAAERGQTADGVRRATASEPEPEPEPDERAIRVGGTIRPPKKTRDVQPVYPQIAQQARVQGVVIIEATIDRQGRVSDARLLRSIPLLDQAALDAVRQWEYEPTRLNGVAVPVIVTVTVNFTLGR